MADAFVGEIMVAGFMTVPRNWAQCAGQILPISQNTALFSLLGTTFGGNGSSNFQLPNMQGNCAVGAGQGIGLSEYFPGEIGGAANVTLLTSNVPPHTHAVNAHSLPGTTGTPGSNAFAKLVAGNLYNKPGDTPTLVPMSQNTLPGVAGGSLPHNNMMPYLALNWVICMSGIFPPRG